MTMERFEIKEVWNKEKTQVVFFLYDNVQRCWDNSWTYYTLEEARRGVRGLEQELKSANERDRF